MMAWLLGISKWHFCCYKDYFYFIKNPEVTIDILLTENKNLLNREYALSLHFRSCHNNLEAELRVGDTQFHAFHCAQW